MKAKIGREILSGRSRLSASVSLVLLLFKSSIVYGDKQFIMYVVATIVVPLFELLQRPQNSGLR